ncbi:hypothetical protein [Mesorhizobium sp. NZP2298]|uniref:hypothetical protein n=1 Tax=Mesorhizobium sp. NZP2298 TaxID=2483403 RepID=UPI0015522108|nr:hypothetical protein [Mesorhizobium sp. NZP2298]QKC99148.1 hypothetical protein EB231_34720 [Mesorhizobium sp. NZP2298]
MELTELVTDKSYWEIRFEDIPPTTQLGARCGCCGHEAPVDYARLKTRSQEAYLRFAARYVRCTKCRNLYHNRIFVFAKV